jgi:hypothetical protein
MNRLLVALLIAFLVVPLAAGCGQKQESKGNIPVIKPMDMAPDSEDSDTDEGDVSGTMPVSSTAPDTKTVGESAIDKAAAIQDSQSKFQAPPAAEQLPSEVLLVADFDTGEKPSNLGGNFGAWNRDPSDPTQWCKENFDNVTRHGEKGFSMKLSYCVDSPNPAYNGFWLMLPNFDASKYDSLNMWVKGDAQAGYTTVFKIELKNAARQTGRYYVSNVTDQWQRISVPLSDFKGLADKTSLTELVIVFEDRMATVKKGTIYIDDISFSKK